MPPLSKDRRNGAFQMLLIIADILAIVGVIWQAVSWSFGWELGTYLSLVLYSTASGFMLGMRVNTRYDNQH
jgi:hypothetical protein